MSDHDRDKFEKLREDIYEKQREDAQRAHDKLDEFHREVKEAAINAGNQALRMALLINGGAAVALLSFVINIPDYAQKKAAANTLFWFASGVGSAVGGIAFAYFTNYCMAAIAFSRQKIWEPPFVRYGARTWAWRLASRIFQVLAIVAGLASLVLFIIGMFEIRAALLS